MFDSNGTISVLASIQLSKSFLLTLIKWTFSIHQYVYSLSGDGIPLLLFREFIFISTKYCAKSFNLLSLVL